MPFFTKESLEELRQKIDLVDLLSSHMELKRAGGSFKGLCPFHDEKSPSFVVQRGDQHYHCFGCGAHGDAIKFLMEYLRVSFSEAVETLAARFHVTLHYTESGDRDEFDRKRIKEALREACRFFQWSLLHTDEGHAALQYLYGRGIDLEFIRKFGIGLAPRMSRLFRQYMHSLRFSDTILSQAGLLTDPQKGRQREFFYDRITFPVRDVSGAVIGFSARKFREETTGGKYVNTPETPVFKKSRILYGLNYCRRRIAKDRRVIVVEGQLDALRLIDSGFDLSVASQGTAFGEGHLAQLVNLGVQTAYLAFDGDVAGREAAEKVGNLFQQKGIEVGVLKMEKGDDPDTYLCRSGPEAFTQLLEEAEDYLSFCVRHFSSQVNIQSPAGKDQLVQLITKRIDAWENPVMVHESKKRLAEKLGLPASLIGAGVAPHIHVKQSLKMTRIDVDPDKVLETDLLRWLLLFGGAEPDLVSLCREHLDEAGFKVDICRKIYTAYLDSEPPIDLLALAIEVDSPDVESLLSSIQAKKINQERWKEQVPETIQKILERNWMREREEIKVKLHSGTCSDDEALTLVKKFDALKGAPPKVEIGTKKRKHEVLDGE